MDLLPGGDVPAAGVPLLYLQDCLHPHGPSHRGFVRTGEHHDLLRPDLPGGRVEPKPDPGAGVSVLLRLVFPPGDRPGGPTGGGGAAGVLAEIFQGESPYTPEEVAPLQMIMLVQDQGEQQVYGKTGTGFGETGWFVGFTQENGQKTYFAVYLSDESREISGSDAQAVALALLE